MWSQASELKEAFLLQFSTELDKLYSVGKECGAFEHLRMENSNLHRLIRCGNDRLGWESTETLFDEFLFN